MKWLAFCIIMHLINFNIIWQQESKEKDHWSTQLFPCKLSHLKLRQFLSFHIYTVVQSLIKAHILVFLYNHFIITGCTFMLPDTTLDITGKILRSGCQILIVTWREYHLYRTSSYLVLVHTFYCKFWQHAKCWLL